ncbi:MAG: PQQ-binding-like beta-propeller repeat protein [Saprospiraceae bacterium]|nr:PQQ-binding-like beta-propeller repeat protein [Saprospiraceae bacterium]
MWPGGPVVLDLARRTAGTALVKPPWGRITAINLNTGDHAWMIPNGETPNGSPIIPHSKIKLLRPAIGPGRNARD